MPPALVSTSLSSQDGPEDVGGPSDSGGARTAHVTAQNNRDEGEGGDDAPRQWAEAAAELTVPQADDLPVGSDASDSSEETGEATG